MRSIQSYSKRSIEDMNFSHLSLDDLLSMKERVEAALTDKVASEQRALEQKLQELKRYASKPSTTEFKYLKADLGKRHYPPVFPKFRNPKNPSETWSGRGLKPKWFVAALAEGKSLKDLHIRNVRSLASSKTKAVK